MTAVVYSTRIAELRAETATLLSGRYDDRFTAPVPMVCKSALNRHLRAAGVEDFDLMNRIASALAWLDARGANIDADALAYAAGQGVTDEIASIYEAARVAWLRIETPIERRPLVSDPLGAALAVINE